MSDNVNHPSHYETGKFECIDVMVETQGVQATKDFCLCNALKYIYRHRRKNGLEDIQKAIWYIIVKYPAGCCLADSLKSKTIFSKAVFSHNTRPPIFCCVLFPDPRQSRDACGLTGYLYTPQRVLVVGLVKVPVFFHLV